MSDQGRIQVYSPNQRRITTRTISALLEDKKHPIVSANKETTKNPINVSTHIQSLETCLNLANEVGRNKQLDKIISFIDR